MTLRQTLTRRAVVRGLLLAAPTALALPAWPVVRCMTASEAIDTLHQGVFQAASEHRMTIAHRLRERYAEQALGWCEVCLS